MGGGGGAAHELAGVAHDVADDAERRAGRVDVRVAHHKLLEDVVLPRRRPRARAMFIYSSKIDRSWSRALRTMNPSGCRSARRPPRAIPGAETSAVCSGGGWGWGALR